MGTEADRRISAEVGASGISLLYLQLIFNPNLVKKQYLKDFYKLYLVESHRQI